MLIINTFASGDIGRSFPEEAKEVATVEASDQQQSE
jgi:hypothetical protein